MSSFIKAIIPPILFSIVKRLGRRLPGQSSSLKWVGNYSSWSAALINSSGYDQPEIFEQVRQATWKVKTGEAAYERDGVVFDVVQYSWPLLAGLFMAASRNRGELRLLDVGGSLGSTYFQNRKFLDLLKSVSWGIVEQPEFVQMGRTQFADDRLSFFSDIANAQRTIHPESVLLSSVLQYIEDPIQLLDEVLTSAITTVLLDRTPFSISETERIAIQEVPSAIYRASYPCRILSSEKIAKYLHWKGFILLEDFASYCDEDTEEISWKGGIWIR